MSDSWYYVSGTQSLGPVSEETLRQLVHEGNVAQSTLVWKEGLPAWKPATQVPGLIPQPAAGRAPKRP